LQEGPADLDRVSDIVGHPEAEGREQSSMKTAEAAAWAMSEAPREVRTSNQASQTSRVPVIVAVTSANGERRATITAVEASAMPSPMSNPPQANAQWLAT
jgi:hypothetical protein